MKTPHLNRSNNTFLVLILLAILGIGLGLGRWLSSTTDPPVNPEMHILVERNRVLDSLYHIERVNVITLKKQIDSLRVQYQYNKEYVNKLKEQRDESIRNIDTMDARSFYEFFSNR